MPQVHATAPLPAYRASGTFTAGTGAITVPYPGTMVAGDVCLLVVSSENQAITLTTANGFVEIPTWSPQSAGTAATNPASRLAVFWKRTVGADASPVVAASGNNTEGVIHCFSGVINTGNPWDTGAAGNDSAANDTTGTIPGSTTTVANDLVVLITSTSNNATSTTNCSGWTNANLASITERQDNSNTAGLGGGSCMATGTKVAAGAYTTTTVTMAATTFKGAMSLALKPPQLPVVTTQAASGVKDSVATANGTITDTGGATNDTEGFVYDTATKSLPGDVAPASSGYASVAQNSGSFSTGAFTVNLTGLTGGVTYFGRAFSHSTAGYSYGGEVSFTTAVISVSVSNGVVSYGYVAPNASKDTTATGLNNTQTITNNSTIAEDFNIQGQNTTCPWTLSPSNGVDQYVHAFSINSGTSWTALTTNYQSLITNIGAGATQNFDLQLTMPTTTNCYNQQSVNVTIQAVAH